MHRRPVNIMSILSGAFTVIICASYFRQIPRLTAVNDQHRTAPWRCEYHLSRPPQWQRKKFPTVADQCSVSILEWSGSIDRPSNYGVYVDIRGRSNKLFGSFIAKESIINIVNLASWPWTHYWRASKRTVSDHWPTRRPNVVYLHGPVRCIIPIYVFVHLTIHSFQQKKTLHCVQAMLWHNQNRALFAANHSRVFALH